MVKALAIRRGDTAGNPIGEAEIKGIVLALRSQGVHVDEVSYRDTPSIPIEEYAGIFVMPSYNSAMEYKWKIQSPMIELHRRARPNAIHLIHCDVYFSFATHIWDGDNPLKAQSKKPIYGDKPVTILGAFDRSIESDLEAWEFVTKKTLRKLPEGSEMWTGQWLTHLVRTPELKDFKEMCKTIEPSDEDIRKFYYGIPKKKLIPSLRDMGLGEDPRDAVFGGVGKDILDVRNLAGQRKKGYTDPDKWAPHVKACEELLFPYDPVKGDYQITRRVLEHIYLEPKETVIDPRVSDRITCMFESEDIWFEESDNEAKLLKERLENL